MLEGVTRVHPGVSAVRDAALLAWLRKRGEPAYRAKQIRRHATHGTAAEFAELTDLPKPLREALATSFSWTSVDAVREEASADGETRKALLRLADGHHIETVLMPHHGARNAVCVSTQAGCPMACAFCATGEMGLVRNLTAGEIVDQVRHWQRELAQRGERVSHVVFMGMGEPFNNSEETARELAALITRHGPTKDAHVNLIPYNPGAGGFRRPPVERMERFAALLQEHGIAATLRISKGQDIAAGCGQLKVAEGKAGL